MPMAMKWDGRFVSIQPLAEDQEPPVALVVRAAAFAKDLLAVAAQAG
jgi:hypothetical protein